MCLIILYSSWSFPNFWNHLQFKWRLARYFIVFACIHDMYIDIYIIYYISLKKKNIYIYTKIYSFAHLMSEWRFFGTFPSLFISSPPVPSLPSRWLGQTGQPTPWQPPRPAAPGASFPRMSCSENTFSAEVVDFLMCFFLKGKIMSFTTFFFKRNLWLQTLNSEKYVRYNINIYINLKQL